MNWIGDADPLSLEAPVNLAMQPVGREELLDVFYASLEPGDLREVAQLS